MGCNSGAHAFLGKISRHRNHFALHQPKVPFLDHSLSYVPWLWQKRLDSGLGDDDGALVQEVSGGGGKTGSEWNVNLLGFADELDLGWMRRRSVKKMTKFGA